MVATSDVEGLRFGRTVLAVAAGDPLDQRVDALLYAANCRGLMSAGGPRSIRLVGGAELERQAMVLAPLELGSAVSTGPGRLAGHGVRAVIHAVVHPSLGAPVKIEVVRRAVAEALRLADGQRLRSLAIPAIGGRPGGDGVERIVVTYAVVDEVVSYLRRSSTRLERIVFVARFVDEVAAVEAAVARARERSWIRSA